jgi:PAS domain S-box-containing protein
MKDRLNHPEGIKSLQRCINDLVSVLALPASWSGREPLRIADTLADALLRMLNLDLVYVWLNATSTGAPIEIARCAPWREPAPQLIEMCSKLGHSLRSDPRKWQSVIRRTVRDEEISIMPVSLGLEGEIGIVIAGSQRADFPEQTEKLLLDVAANQALIGLQQARLLSEQRHLSVELDERVAQRTQQLADANEELRRQITRNKQVEKRLRNEKNELRRSEARSKAIVDSALDCLVAIDHEARITEFSPAAERTFGYRREEVLGRSLSEVLVPSSLREKHEQGFARYLETGEVRVLGRRLETIALCADGREIPVELAITRIELPGPPSFNAYIRDISARKHNEQALHEALVQLARSEKRWRSVFENSAVGVALTDLGGRFLAANPMYQQMLGYTEDELRSLSLLDVTLEDYAEPIRKLVLEVIAGTRQEFQMEKQYRRKDGSLMWARNHVSLVPGTERFDRFLMTIVDDISDAKRAEKALQANERNLVSIINTIPTTAWSTLPDGYCDFLNQRWLDYAGMTTEEAQGWGWGTVIHPDDVQHLVEYWQSCLAAGTPVDTEARMRRSDGTYRWFIFRANPLRDESGAIVRWYGTNIDIEDRKRSEEALRESEQSFRLIVDGIAGLVAIMSPTGEVEVVNRQVLNYFGKTIEQLKGWSTGNAVHPDDVPRVVSTWVRSVETASIYDVDHRLLRADGVYRWFHARGLPLCDAEGRILRWYVLLTDINDRKQAEEALTRARAELSHANRVTSLGVLTASIAHEVNQPLSGIVTNASTCLRMLDSDPPNIEGARETARRTIRDGNRASDVITRLRALFRKRDIGAESVDLSEAAREVIALSLSELQRNRVILKDELADDLPHVSGDRIQLQQVILNLLRNASEAMSTVLDRPRHLLIRTELDEANHVRLTVRDSGIGFDPGIAEQLFESFYTTKDDGMGIGLSVSRSIIASHQGRIWATPNDGPGSAFAFSIPRESSRESIELD